MIIYDKLKYLKIYIFRYNDYNSIRRKVMSIQELETATKKLSTKELASLTTWLIDYHEQIWDQQIEDDLDSGKLDQLLDEIDGEYEAGLAKSL